MICLTKTRKMSRSFGFIFLNSCTNSLLSRSENVSYMNRRNNFPKARLKLFSRMTYRYQTHYLPYNHESIEIVKEYDKIINFINSLSKVGEIKDGCNKIVTKLYTDSLKIQTDFVPLMVELDRKKFIEDWNEVISIITEMKVVPEEADQVSLEVY